MDKKVLTLAIVGSVAVGSIIYGIAAPSPSRKKAELLPLPPGVTRPPIPGAADSSPPAGAAPHHAPFVVPPALVSAAPHGGIPAAAQGGDSFMSPGTGVRSKRPRTPFTSWGRDPFSRADLLILRGIAWDPENPKAIISDRIAEIGEEVGGNMIIDIRPDSVILSNGRDDFILTLPEDSTKEDSGIPKIPNGPPRELKAPQPPKPRMDRPPPGPHGG